MTLQTILYFYDIYSFEKLMVNVKAFADEQNLSPYVTQEMFFSKSIEAIKTIEPIFPIFTGRHSI